MNKLRSRVGYNTIKCSEIHYYTQNICSHAPKSSFLNVFLCFAFSYCPALPLFNGKRDISIRLTRANISIYAVRFSFQSFTLGKFSIIASYFTQLLTEAAGKLICIS